MSTHSIVSPDGPAHTAGAEPVPAPTRRAALVVRVDPARGWSEADLPRRVAALAAGPLALVYLLMASTESWPAGATTLLLLAGPPTFYSLARVVRPYAPGGERTVRHWAASTSAAYALPGLLLMSPGSSGSADAGILLALVAAFGGVVTAAWGLVALVVRLAQRGR